MLTKYLRFKGKTIFSTVSIFALLFSCSAINAFEVTGIAAIVDGDTINLEGYKIRLIGIDAPEIKQKCQYLSADWDCGLSSKNSLIAKISGKPISCDLGKQDLYKRFLGTCFLNGDNLNEWMVLNGYAVAYRQYSRQYVTAENEARTKKSGIWSSEFDMPQIYRKAKKVKHK